MNKIFLAIIILNTSFAHFIYADEAQKQKPLEEVDDWTARLEFAKLLTNLKKYNEALDQFDKLLKEKPDAIDVQVEVARVYYYLEQYGKAISIINHIPQKKLTPQDKVLLGDILLAMKKYHEAEGIYRQHLKENPEDLLVKLKLAELLSWQKQYPESIHLYEQLLHERPDDIQLRRKYAYVLIWMGEDKKAAEELEKTLR